MPNYGIGEALSGVGQTIDSYRTKKREEEELKRKSLRQNAQDLREAQLDPYRIKQAQQSVAMNEQSLGAGKRQAEFDTRKMAAADTEAELAEKERERTNKAVLFAGDMLEKNKAFMNSEYGGIARTALQAGKLADFNDAYFKYANSKDALEVARLQRDTEAEKNKGTDKAAVSKAGAELRKELNSNKKVNTFNEIDGTWSRMGAVWPPSDLDLNSTETRKRGAIDQALITLYNKLLDPGSVVRESEYARTPENNAALERLTGAISKIKEGGAGITDAYRQEIFNTGKKLYESSVKKYKETLTPFLKDAQDQGLNIDRVFSPRDMDLMGLKMEGEAKPGVFSPGGVNNDDDALLDQIYPVKK